MGIFDGLMGNATDATSNDIEKAIGHLLTDGETIEAGFKLIRDLMVFTNKRLIMVDKQGVTGKKTDFHSVPYRSISHFSVETAGTFDLDAELKIWISSAQAPLFDLQFRKDDSIAKIQRLLAAHCL